MEDDYRYDNYPQAEEKRSYRRGFLCGILAALFIALAALLVYTVLHMDLSGQNGSSQEALVGSSQVKKKTQLLKALIDKYYLDEAEESDLVDGMYAGLISGLDDPYSVYYTEEEYEQMMESTSGTYAGIGALMSQNMETGLITITRPFDGSPAQEAGLQAGDILVAVDGEEIQGEDLSTIVARIKGEPGTDVQLTLNRDGNSFDVTVTRDTIEVTTVSGKMLDEKTGYIAILEFDEVTTDQFRNALTELKNEGMEQLIVDLRDNPGGNLDVVTDILDEILPEGLIVYTEDKYGNRSEITSDAEHCLEIPMAVLVNGNSASASEIFAGAIRDYDWGILVGTTTFGKGIVQRLFDLGDGTAVKLTISKYYTPSGQNIHGVGIEPDVEVELPEDAYEDGIVTEEEDTQLQKALEILEEN